MSQATHMRTSPLNEPPRPPGGGSIRVLCVDDHEVLVEGLRAQFAIDSRIKVVGTLSSAERLIEEVERVRPDVVLLDIEMPGPDAFETADRVRRARPTASIIFLSAHIRDGYVSSAYACGASGYFSKADALEDIVAGVCEVVRQRGGTFIMGPKVKERCSHLSPAGRPGGRETHFAGLTAREVEVLRLIGKGRSRGQIAAELSRSAKTIDGHQDRIMKKLKVESRAELIRFAIREGLAEA